MKTNNHIKVDINYLPDICEECNNIYLGKEDINTGIRNILSKTLISNNYFNFIYHSFEYMLNGKIYKRDIGSNIREYLLNYIYENYGREKLEIALNAFLMHIEYLEKVMTQHRKKDRELYKKYKTILENDIRPFTEAYIANDNEEAELIPLIKDLKREEIIQELKELKTTDPEEITYNTKKYKRDTKTVLQLKELHNYTCQICGKKIRKKDGSFYIEAAHITPKSEKGPELPENLLILCPNHHKEFDYGELEILYRDKEKIRFKLNGEEYCISLKLE